MLACRPRSPDTLSFPFAPSQAWTSPTVNIRAVEEGEAAKREQLVLFILGIVAGCLAVYLFGSAIRTHLAGSAHVDAVIPRSATVAVEHMVVVKPRTTAARAPSAPEVVEVAAPKARVASTTARRAPTPRRVP